MLAYIILVLLLHHNVSSIEIKLNQGIVQGEFQYVAGKAVNFFLGIPYAQAPIGNLRFRPPNPHPGMKLQFKVGKTEKKGQRIMS